MYIVTQHTRDRELMEGLINYLGCGKYSIRKEAGDFKVLSITDINEKIVPFFSEYQLLPPPRLPFFFLGWPQLLFANSKKRKFGG